MFLFVGMSQNHQEEFGRIYLLLNQKKNILNVS
jgi:hypothetical protein